LSCGQTHRFASINLSNPANHRQAFCSKQRPSEIVIVDEQDLAAGILGHARVSPTSHESLRFIDIV